MQTTLIKAAAAYEALAKASNVASAAIKLLLEHFKSGEEI